MGQPLVCEAAGLQDRLHLESGSSAAWNDCKRFIFFLISFPYLVPKSKSQVAKAEVHFIFGVN